MSQLYCKNRERAIKNAASIAGLMLTTEALVADMKEDDKKSAESTY
jgi:chaperonin GroEL (HSP60 family)